MERKVSTEDIKIGMYVSRLDRPWLESPFLFQGFFIKDGDDIRDLKKHCQYVYIDLLKGAPAARYLDDTQQRLPQGDQVAPVVYEDTASVKEELPRAREIHKEAAELVSNIMAEIRAGKVVSLDAVEGVVKEMVGSILRNPDAFMWLTRLKDKDSYTYGHAIDACTLATAFGRQLGFPKERLQRLAMSAMLFDVGKMRLPEGLLRKPGALTERERMLLRKHVEFGVAALSKAQGVDKETLEAVWTHHERFNGKGYPRGLVGKNIPLFGRITAIVDCYDAICSQRPYSDPISPHEAILKLYEWRGHDFQEDLVEHFIQSLGVYPAGTLVELSSGEVAVVIAQNRFRRLRPKVMLILDADKEYLDFFPVIDLMADTEDKAGKPLEIRGVLEAGAYGIDPKEFYL